MFYQSTIRKIIAVVALLIFAFSITPQKNMHDLVAKHVDPSVCKVHLNAPIDQLEKSSIHCSFDQLVVTSAFLHYDFELTLPKHTVVVAHHATVLSLKSLCAIYQFDSRGPPTV